MQLVDQEKIYYPGLDGLRFFAFLLVFIHHAPLISTNPVWVALHDTGWMGVDLFLCLSAFLFTKLLYVEYQRTGAINISYFYIRRTLRIWPLYFVFVILVVLYTYYRVDHFDLYIWRVLGVFTFTDNFFASVFGYNRFFFAAHLWTISYEEQFYAVIPWALRRLFQFNQRIRALILLVVMAVGFIVRAGFVWLDIPHPAIWVLPVTHFDSIIIGLMLGLGILDPLLSKIPRLLTGVVGLFALIMVFNLPALNDAGWYVMLIYPLVGLGMGLILYVILHAGNSPLLCWLSSQPLRFLGKVSYGLYVYHFVGIKYVGRLFVVDRVDNVYLWIFFVFILPLLFTIAISALSYYVLEKPFLRLKDRFSIILSRPI